MLVSGSAAASLRVVRAESTASESRPLRQAFSASIDERLDGGVHAQDAAVLAFLERGRLGLGEAVLADHLQLARLDLLHARPVRLHELGLHVGHGRHGAALLRHDGHLLARAGHELLDEPVHHLRALEDVRVLQDVGLVGEDLLDPQRPLLVPRPRQAERLVPGGKL